LKPSIQRLRAEIASDRKAWLDRVDELHGLDLARAELAVLAQAAVALHHGYGAVESILERVARSIEGSLPTGRDWHVALLENMALDIESVRPRVLSDESLRGLRTLLAFRHFFRHAYAIALDAARLQALVVDMLALKGPLEHDLAALDAYLGRVATDADGE
jgi:hypothetical protein